MKNIIPEKIRQYWDRQKSFLSNTLLDFKMKKSNIDDFNTYCGRMEEIKFRIAKIETILAGGSIGEEIFNTESTQTGNMSAQS